MAPRPTVQDTETGYFRQYGKDSAVASRERGFAQRAGWGVRKPHAIRTTTTQARDAPNPTPFFCQTTKPARPCTTVPYCITTVGAPVLQKPASHS